MDNFIKTCPPKMSDGRLFHDARSSVVREENVKYINGIVRDDHHRLFYQQNANQIMDAEWDHLRKTQSCWTNGCVHTYPTRVHPPLMFEERANYNASPFPTRLSKFPCSPNPDYRLTQTKN